MKNSDQADMSTNDLEPLIKVYWKLSSDSSTLSSRTIIIGGKCRLIESGLNSCWLRIVNMATTRRNPELTEVYINRFLE